MKRFILLILIVSVCLSLIVACSYPDENSSNKADMFINYTVIEGTTSNWGLALVYDNETKIVYHYDNVGSNAGIRGLYYIYKNGAIYAAIYDNGQIKPVPFATS